jgi:hypothetical protein
MSRRVVVGALMGLALVSSACLPPVPVADARFASSITAVTRQRLGLSWREGCPVAPADLRLVSVTYLGFDAKPHRGELIVNARIASRTVTVFRTLYAARFPIRRMETSEKFLTADDFAADGSFVERLDVPDTVDDTASFMCRPTTQASSWSAHAYGLAIDVNPLENPYVKDGKVVPINGRPNLQRSKNLPGLIHAGSLVIRAFAAAGLSWGGNWRSLKDYMHFTATGH